MYLIVRFILLFDLALAADAPQARTGEEPRFTAAPADESADAKALIDRAEATLASGKTCSDLLSDPAFVPAHEWPRFRRLIRSHAKNAPLALVTANEPGTPILVKGTVKDRDAKPVTGAVLYIYHTSAKGWYSDRAAHFAAHEGDRRHARLFGYLITGEDGIFEFRSIRPAGYPNSNLPAHIHVEVERSGQTGAAFVTEIRFADDPRLTAEAREQSPREGFLICEVKRGEGNVQQLSVDLDLR